MIIGFRPFFYKVAYNNFFDVREYRKNLENKYHEFFQRLIFTPSKFNSSNLKTHLVMLNLLLNDIQMNVKIKQEKLINRRFPECKHFENDKNVILNFEDKKLCKMLFIQNTYIQKSISIIDTLAQKEQIPLPDQSKISVFQNKFKTQLTNAELSYFIKLIMDVITDKNYNKKDLSKLLSQLFETRETKAPSEKKLYQLFTKVSPETKAKMKELVFELKLVAQE